MTNCNGKAPMANDYTQDPGYQETRGKMFGSHLKGAVWGLLGAAALVGGIALCVSGGGVAAVAGGIAMGLFGLFSVKKAYNAQVDERAGLEDINARETAKYIQERGPSQDQSMSADLPSRNWQESVAAQREAVATQELSR
ncbi:MAG TPA: hypothetical protein VFT64_00540 [Rickettsiales bacterium]|nr:hypothetical protein [Rickettsiales bacterium]